MYTLIHSEDRQELIALFVERLLAHGNYLHKKISDDMDRHDFFDAMLAMITHIIQTNDVPSPSSDFMMKFKSENKEYVTKAVDIYNEIYYIHDERFISGRTGDAHFEKL